MRTFIDLFKKPEVVIDGYISGVRKRYVNPISFFGISLTLSGLSTFIIKKFYLNYLDYSQLFRGDMYNNPISKKMLEDMPNATFEYSSLILSAMIPFMAIMSVIIFFDKRYNLTEHVIIYLYSMSALSIISVCIGQIVLFFTPESYFLFSFLFYVLLILYHACALKRIFKLNFGQLVIKTILFGVLFFVFYIGFVIITFLIMLLTGVINLEDFRPK